MSILSRLDCPVFAVEGVPNLSENDYIVTVDGLVKEDKSFSLSEIKKMPFSRINSRLTSVSQWSVRADWDGVTWNDFIKNIELDPEADHANFYSYSGYTTAIPLKELIYPKVMLVYAVDGEPLESEYGGPLRMVVPNLWGYKSCKWLQRIEFIHGMIGGFWEDRGYTRSGIIEPTTVIDMNTKTQRKIKGGGEVTEF
jgi:DMSO/TMAO reductase YedYZ molybdopterin-dependent catalytic subunit